MTGPQPARQRPAEPFQQPPAELSRQRPAEPFQQPPAEPFRQPPTEPSHQRPAEPFRQRPAEPSQQPPVREPQPWPLVPGPGPGAGGQPSAYPPREAVIPTSRAAPLISGPMGIPPTRSAGRPRPGLDPARQPYAAASHPGGDPGAQPNTRRPEAAGPGMPPHAVAQDDTISDGESARWPGYGHILDGIDVI
ncbi:hypothetical protein [Frankia sp. CiP1_Cm_nod2]|uniref:hypothetical protein n=1 Tax=Frankia sp. CiP1_Cm_nod2 TaxID=2897161 RepID=UPI0020242275